MKTILLLALMSIVSLSAAEPAAKKTEEAILAGGCFWCTEGCYLVVKGVSSVTSGYTGGTVENPSYEQVCTGTTGHAEAVKIVFDPSVVSYKDIVELFWYAHDPTTLNYQGNDHGTQYRSGIFYTTDEQKKIAEESKAEHQKEFDNPIVTEITAATKFYPAEKYHQDFANKNPNQGYVCAIVKPKVDKFKKKLAQLSK